MASAWLDVDWPAHTQRASIDGSEVTYVDIGSGPAMVFIHGLGGAWQNWLENLPFFAATHRCIAMDLAGFGVSEAVVGDVSIERYARAQIELLEHLGIESAAVVGNSMGGFIALEMAIRRPDVVERLVLVSPAVFWQESRRARPLIALAGVTETLTAKALAGGKLALERRPKLRETVLGLGGVHAPGDLSRELQAELIATSQRTPGYVPAFAALAGYSLRDQMGEITAPTLIVWGADDPLVPVKHADELASLIPDARKVVYEATGHLAMLEQPGRFNPEVAAFVAARRASARAG